MTLTLDEGREIVSYTRSVISANYGGDRPKTPKDLEKLFSEKRGVFVTLEKHPEGKLRGCIGFPEPRLPFGQGVSEAAISAATADPRFPPVRSEELSSLTIEVSVLSKPKLIKVEKPIDYLKEVVVGRDGLIAERGYFRGLLLPQVPVEWNWDGKEFLAHTCMKAGLPPECWLDGETKLYAFQAQVFSEIEPKGEVVEKQLVREAAPQQ